MAPSTERCVICGEDFTPETKGDGKAEMVDPDTMRAIEAGEIEEDDSYIVHFSCGEQKGYVLA